MRAFILLLISVLILTACTSTVEPVYDDMVDAARSPEAESTTVLQHTDDIFVNQVGYLPYGKKTFWTAIPSQAFTIVDVETGSKVYSGAVRSLPSDPATGLTGYYGTFDDVNATGYYTIVLDDTFQSNMITITDHIYHAMAADMQHFFYLQRCGVDLSETYAGVYHHPACHIGSGQVYDGGEVIESVGGWHDAGDYGRYTVPAVRTIADLLLAYELYPDKVSDDGRIPESGNHIPDILDEARVGLSWLLTMQREDGGVYHKYTSTAFCGMVMPQLDFMTQYAMAVSPTATYGFAAIMAKASYIFRDLDAEFSKKCLDAAEHAFVFMEMHPDWPMFENPKDIYTGDYKDSSALDERYWASVELYLATDEKRYLDLAQQLYAPQGTLVWSDTLEWYDIGFLGTFSYLLNQPYEDDWYAALLQDMKDTADQIVTTAQSHMFYIAMDASEYTWGSNMIVTNRANFLLITDRFHPDDQYTAIAQAHMDYLLGCNALGQSYVTGYGRKPARFPHHRPSIADGVKAAFPGMLVGGPNGYREDNVALNMLDEDTPPALCYVDDSASFSMNEVTIYWNASALLLTLGVDAS